MTLPRSTYYRIAVSLLVALLVFGGAVAVLVALNVDRINRDGGWGFLLAAAFLVAAATLACAGSGVSAAVSLWKGEAHRRRSQMIVIGSFLVVLTFGPSLVRTAARLIGEYQEAALLASDSPQRPRAGGIQTPAANALPALLRAHLNDDRFDIVTSVRGLPLGVREELPALFGTTNLEIAEPGAAFRATDVVLNPTLPVRRLVRAACSSDHCIVYYERGGIAHTWHAAIFSWTPAATRFEWGGTAPGGLRTIDELRKAALSGAIRNFDSW